MTYEFIFELTGSKIIFVTTLEDALSVGEVYDVEFNCEDHYGRAVELENKNRFVYLVYVQVKNRTPLEFLPTLGHELTHVVDFISTTFGFDDIEFRGYTHALLLRKILRRMMREKIVILKKHPHLV